MWLGPGVCRLCCCLQGRISRRVTVPLPDEAGRAAILGVHLREVTLDESAGDKTQLARQLATLTAGFSGGLRQRRGTGATRMVTSVHSALLGAARGSCASRESRAATFRESRAALHPFYIFTVWFCVHPLAGAELSNIVNEALLLTARRGSEAVGLAELLEGLSRTR